MIAQNLPQFNIRVNKNTFIMTPMSEEHLELNSQSSKKFLALLKREKNTYDYTIEENTVNVTVHSEVHQVINFIGEALIKSNLLAEGEEKNLREKLRQLIFKNQAFVEYSSIKTINKYPHNHPLRKYENITHGIENILCEFIKNEDSKSTINKLSRLKLSPDTPRIITKTIDKLTKFH
ncbi:hypothetical protein [Wolbachia endosymbiont of Chironomus riparius]|uniref:hypothetical protein n=1 Tax=Wolbachia endosymbiont of Chironomus riparius TaxID=2883238 RepID=UPI0020A0AD72|nr:hypothetical protein [Wolbachia endosymbiont of Chironomus riparius]